MAVIFFVWLGAVWLLEQARSDILLWVVVLPIAVLGPGLITFLLVRDAVRRRRINPLLAPAAAPPLEIRWLDTENVVVGKFFAGVQMRLADVGPKVLNGVHSLFHPDLQATQSAEEFTELVNRNSRLFYPIPGWRSSSDSSGGGKATERLKFKVEGGTEVIAKFRLVQEDDRWQIVGYRIEDQLGGFGGGTSP